MKKIHHLLILVLFILTPVHLALASDHFTKESIMNERIERIERIFNQLRADNTEILNDFYHPDVHFLDPIGEIRGLEEMKAYYRGMYKNVNEIRFDFPDHTVQADTHFATWIMTYSVDQLNGGRDIVVSGVSDIRFDPETNLVIYHRDYFDMGEMVYEHISVIGRLIRYIKGRFKH